MKLCTACGRRYGEDQLACPKCYNADFVTVEDERTPSSHSALVVCPKCDAFSDGGTSRCSRCGALLAPFGLKLISILGLIGSPAVIVLLILTLNWKMYWWVALPDMLTALLAIPLFWGLLHASVYAWSMLRLGLLISLGVVLLLVIGAHIWSDAFAQQTATSMFTLRAFGVVALWFYTGTRPVMDFVGKEENIKD